jgi:uncharacterized membrane protein
VSSETIAKGDGSRLVEPRRFVVRDPQAFAAVWAAHAGPDAPVPAVDFRTRMVVAVFAGQRPTPGFEVEITGTRREGAALVVIVDEKGPPPSVASAQILVSPFHVVTLPRENGEIRFNTADPSGQRPAPTHRGAPDGWLEESESSTGLTPQLAASLAYLAGPFSGILVLAIETTSRFVRFHAWQAVLGLGLLGTAAAAFLLLAFAMLIVSATVFWVTLWLAAATGVTWVAVWAICLVQAFKGRAWKLPLAGAYAERRATSLRASAAR